MNYFVGRNGQTYGPYSLEAVEKYLAEGSILATDMARSETMPNWLPLNQVIAIRTDMVPATAGSVIPPFGPPAVVSTGNPPPSLHWAIVFVINMVTGGVFLLVWVFVQSFWVKSIDPSSKATRDYIIGTLIGLGGGIAFVVTVLLGMGVSALSSEGFSSAALGSIGLGFVVLLGLMLVAIVFHMKAVFGIRASLLRHYNTVEPINLRLSTAMTLFFNVFYFQYHFTRIAEWKRTGVLQPQK